MRLVRLDQFTTKGSGFKGFRQTCFALATFFGGDYALSDLQLQERMTVHDRLGTIHK